jgi:choline dehydrogenase-like flavoprotein
VSRSSSKKFLSVDVDGKITISYPSEVDAKELPLGMLLSLRKLGGWGFRGLVSETIPGNGFHHVGCLPMRSNPGPYQTHKDGRLWGHKRVRIIDGSVLPSLPAKNHSLTIMANAARIADKLKKCEY